MSFTDPDFLKQYYRFESCDDLKLKLVLSKSEYEKTMVKSELKRREAVANVTGQRMLS